MKKILITGGPVYAHLDSVKIITNRFKGGRIAELAYKLAFRDKKIRVTYLCSCGSKQPKALTHPLFGQVNIIYHTGFHDYYKKVLELAPKHDAVILGAAVCNLIPIKPWKKKFPSHNYKVGDRIPIDFTIAPRVIDEVKKVAPKTKLFGFKLLQGVKHKELIDAAYDIVLESGAVCVFANDADCLDRKFAVTKEKGVIEFRPECKDDIYRFILDCVNDKYYSTIEHDKDFDVGSFHCVRGIMLNLLNRYQNKFKGFYGREQYKFGTIAVRLSGTNFFLTTARGKKDMCEFSIVYGVDNSKRKVYATKKATLNAPLLHNIFKRNKDIKAIVHYHENGNDNIPHAPYAPSGTLRDSKGPGRDIYLNSKDYKAFEIEGHGTFELLTEGELYYETESNCYS